MAVNNTEKPTETKEAATTEEVETKEVAEADAKDDSKNESGAAEDTSIDDNKHEDGTLILSAEEEAEISAQTNEDDAVKQDEQKKDQPKASAKKPVSKASNKCVWIANIARATKAADLKKLFSEKFKVESAKIVTNGKSFFGYLSLETAEMAESSVKELDGKTLNGKKMTVTTSRPDIKRSTETSKRREPAKPAKRVVNGKTSDDKEASDDKKKETDKKEGDVKKDGKDTATDEKKKEDPKEELERLRRRDARTHRLITDLRADVKRLTMELQNNRRRLTETSRRLDSERDRKASMRRDIEQLEMQLKSERRKALADLDQMEKKRKLEEMRYHEERALLNKELEECRRLREYLQKKVDEAGLHSRPSGGRMSPRNSRSSGGDKMGRPRMDDRRGQRSPPPPPKINAGSRRSRDRSPPYKGNKKPRHEEPSYNNHYGSQSSFVPNKPLLGSYPPSAPRPLYPNTAYPDSHRYQGAPSFPSQYPMSGPSMGAPMSRPMGGYSGPGGQSRKY